LAGLSWKVMALLFFGGLASLPVRLDVLHDYQRQRILTLIDPEADPLGKGFHIIQSTIAVGSGGILGKGWGNGTQTHLEFIPERHTDFIFAVLSEEFGLLGNSFLLVLYALIIGRGLMIAANAPTLFSRLLAGSDHADLLHLRLREHGHGQRHPAGGGRAAALRQLRRHGAGDAVRRRGHTDEHPQAPDARAEMMRSARPSQPPLAGRSLLARCARVLPVAANRLLCGLRLRRVPSGLGSARRPDCAACAAALMVLLAGCGSQPPRSIERDEPSHRRLWRSRRRRSRSTYSSAAAVSTRTTGRATACRTTSTPCPTPSRAPSRCTASPTGPIPCWARTMCPSQELKPYKARGVGSWYGRKFHGQKTSIGEVYDMFAMTAAHPTLPIPSYARVTNLANGKSVVVRVNDRGPFLHDRVIDLSYAAAWKLGYIGSGSAQVEVESILPGETLLAAKPAPPQSRRGRPDRPF
jgi:rare lipoprotein A (peptidoglycan hydrolase)